MTVAELIERLKEFPQDAPVVCYDGGRDSDHQAPDPELVDGTIWEWGWEPGITKTNENRCLGVRLY